MYRRIALASSILVVALAGCGPAAPQTNGTAQAQPRATISAPASPSPNSPTGGYAGGIDAQYPDQDWAAKDSPALTMSREEAGKYLEDATAGPDGEVRLDFSDFETLNETDMDVVIDVASDMSRLGRDLLLVTLNRDALARTGSTLDSELMAAELEAGWALCSAAREGADFAEVYTSEAEEHLQQLDDYMATGASQEELARLQLLLASKESGLAFAQLQCPEFADEALKAQEQIYGTDGWAAS